jgi:hypothetical protein
MEPTQYRFHQVWNLHSIAIHLGIEVSQTLKNALEASAERGVIRIVPSGGMLYYELA